MVWEVNLPAEEVPVELPEPALGINFARDGMLEKDWLLLLLPTAMPGCCLSPLLRFKDLVAIKLTGILLSFSIGLYFLKSCRYLQHFQTNRNAYLYRKRLFNMINEIPTIFEVVTRSAKKTKTKERSSSENQNDNKSQVKFKSGKIHAEQTKLKKPQDELYSFWYSPFFIDLKCKKYFDGKGSKTIQAMDKEEGLDEDEHGDTLCGACGDNYASDEYWICCDICEKWFHGICVKITPSRAEHIKHYKCPSCSNKRARP
ncbi:hypothetical protein HID58_008931 [Brassica napus]|uniref:PHD finger protein ALFIN-LIKE n=1 Tax=Brassica napus TaxID=3708 RepID=A0ABQ8DR12_BRANA|nr:hypothetical protein HID58_008931 [Brassica napus]